MMELGLKCKREADSAKAVGDLKKLTEAHADLKRKHDALQVDFKLVKAKVK
jgi:hypothetical protein